MNSAAKHQKTIDESIAHLLSRAADSRRLEVVDLQSRVFKSVEKYVLRDDENASGVDVKEFVDGLNADDLCLIIACEKNDETAWSELVAKFDQTVKSAARKVSNNAEDADDLAGSIWAELYGLKEKDGKAKGKLAYYSGRGSLAGWLRAVVSQLAIDQYRKDSKFVQIEEDREFENLANQSAENSENSKIVAHTANPEEVFAEQETRRNITQALNSAIAKLEAEDRLLLKLYYFNDLKLKDIGATLGFHEATASRKIVRVQTEVRKSLEKILVAEYGWREDEVKRNLTETASKLELNLEKLLAMLLFAVFMQDFLN
jgi:RNA polymerase sigma-70 factor (ECF subfamily)